MAANRWLAWLAWLSPALALSALSCSPANVAAPDAGAQGPSDAASPGGDGGALSPAQQVCKDYAYARCTRLQTCSPTMIQTTYDDVATCEALYTQSCVDAIEASASGRTATQVQGCTAAIPDWACSDIIYALNVPPGCGTAEGPRAAGASCAVNDQCQSQWCRRNAGSACGTCGPLPQAGDPCVAGFQCGAGFSCQSGKCDAYAQLGASCENGPCIDGLTCAGGVCVAGVSTAGASCSFSGAGCDSYAGLACNAATGTCQTLEVVGPGQACGTVANQQQSCVAGRCLRGACVGDVPLGGACHVLSDQCIAFTDCVADSDGGGAGTCRVPGSVACP